MDRELRKEYFDKAFKLHSSGMGDEAKVFYNKILAENPDDYEVMNLLGMLELQAKNYDLAENWILKAIELKPAFYFYETLSRVYNHKKDWQKELDVLLETEKLFGLNYETAFRLGLVFRRFMNYELSEKYYLKALELQPLARDTYMNLGNLYTIFHEFEKARKCFEQCLTHFPDDREFRYFLGLIYFRFKNYEKGLPCFESRLCRETAIKTSELTYPNLMKSAKLWQGEDISDKVLYTYYEAGFGDMLMFARYLPMLIKKCKKIILKPQIELTQLFRENFPEIEVMDYFTPEQELQFDYHIPFLSIPYVLGLSTEEMFVGRKQYLRATPERVKEYKENFFNNDKFKIAIKWQGNTYYERERVIDVDAFAKLFELPNTQVYSAQTFAGAEEFEKLSAKYNIVDLSKSFKDFSCTAGAIENLDLIICNDTSLAHLAGAMNKPCAVILPYNYNWRWHTDLNYCDWYESVKLYLVEQNETWADAINRVIEDIIQGNL